MTEPVIPVPHFEELRPRIPRPIRKGEGATRGQGRQPARLCPSEDVSGAAGDFLEAAMNRGSLTRGPRVLTHMTVSSASQCRCYVAHRRHQLAGLEVADAKIAAIFSPNSADLSAHERAFIRFVLATRQSFLPSE